MYRIRPQYLLWAMDNLVAGNVVNHIKVPDHVAEAAKLSLDRMIEITKAGGWFPNGLLGLKPSDSTPSLDLPSFHLLFSPISREPFAVVRGWFSVRPGGARHEVISLECCYS